MWKGYLRFALRGLARHPGSSFIIVTVLAVGIGANAATFSVVDAVLLDPLPYPESGELVTIWETNRELGRDHDGPSPANLLDWRERNEAFAGIAASRVTSITHFGERATRELSSARVSADFFPVMGTEARLGRAFGAETVARNERVAVLSHGMHRRVFGGDPAAVGREVILDGEAYRVVGVMPPEFNYPSPEVELWLPWNFQSAYAHRGGPPRDFRFLDVVARLRPGVGLKQARANLQRIAADLAREHPATNAGWGVRLVPLREEIVGSVNHVLWVLFGSVALVLLVGCANAAALLLTRAQHRMHEIAIRRAMGASRTRLVALGLTESLVLGALGGLAGLVFAHAALTLLLAFQPGDLPRLREIGVDGEVLAFTAAASVFAVALSGVLPALLGTRGNPARQLRPGAGRGMTAGRSIRRSCRALVVAELAAALVLLVGAGLLVRSYAGLRAVDPGFDPRRVLVAQINLNPDGYDQEATRAYYARLLRSVRALPGVEAAGAVSALPMSPVAVDFDRPFWRPGAATPESARPEAAIRIATPDYFTALGMDVRAGRDFDASDRRDGAAVVVVNETLARRLWGDRSPIDRRVTVDYRGINTYRVVGVVGDTRSRDLRSEPPPEIFLPHAQVPYLPMSVAIRTGVDPERLSAPVRDLALEIDPGQPVQDTVTLERLVSASVARERFAVVLLASLAGTALLLAVTGTYGLLAFSVRQQSREIGLRRALGARRGTIRRMILGESLRLALLGIALGLALALGLTHLLAHLLFGVGPFDAGTFASASLLLGATTVLASLVPARRAIRMEPAIVLREE